MTRHATAAHETHPTPESLPPGQRLVSLDALRGFDMFWIIGGEGLIQALPGDGPVISFIKDQFEHRTWEGVAFYDLIFPLFVFIVGASLVFSLTKTIRQEGQAAAFRRVFFRSAALYLIGLLYYHAPQPHGEQHLRLMGVLQRIALAYFGASLIFLFFGLRGRIIATATLLIVYWALMSFVPVPGVGHSFAEGKNLANWIDQRYLPGFKWDGHHDPEGLLSTLTAIGTCMLGVFAGMLLRNGQVSPMRKVAYLLAAGAAGVLLGELWGLQFPVIKKIWSSSYVLVAGGYACIILAMFYLVIDIWKVRGWCVPFIWIGMNALTLYVIENIVDFHALSLRFVGFHARQWLGEWANFTVAAVAVALILLLARFLYKRQIFLRL